MFQTGGVPFPTDGLGKFGRGPGWSAAGKGKGPRVEDDERGAHDWFCPHCRERNFVRRTECFKCGAAKPADGGPSLAPPKIEDGATVNGMVKSYNRKGWGFLMVLGAENQDIYYTRDNLSPNLETCDIPGRYVTFEIHKAPGGRKTAVSIRPMGEEKPNSPWEFCNRPAFTGAAGGKGFTPAPFVGSVGGKGFSASSFSAGFSGGSSSGFSSFKDGAVDTSHGEAPGRPSVEAASRAGRDLSPHAGSRAYAMAAMAGRGRSSSRKKQKSSKRQRQTSSSGSSSSESRSSSTSQRKSKKKRKKKKKRRRGSSSSSKSRSSSCVIESKQPEPAPLVNQEVEKAKAEAFEEMLKLRDVVAKDARMSEWRALLRKWHPDKNPDRVEVATTVFQFLQRGKPMLEGI